MPGAWEKLWRKRHRIVGNTSSLFRRQYGIFYKKNAREGNDAMYISDNAVPIIVGKNIQRCRVLRGWSQTQLANEAEMDRADISRYENGSREMKITALFRIAAALQVDIGQLFLMRDESDADKALPGKAWQLNKSGQIVMKKVLEIFLQTPELTEENTNF